MLTCENEICSLEDVAKDVDVPERKNQADCGEEDETGCLGEFPLYAISHVRQRSAAGTGETGTTYGKEIAEKTVEVGYRLLRLIAIDTVVEARVGNPLEVVLGVLDDRMR